MNLTFLNRLVDRVAVHPKFPIILVVTCILMILTDLGLKIVGQARVWPVVAAVCFFFVGTIAHSRVLKRSEQAATTQSQSNREPEPALKSQTVDVASKSESDQTIIETIQQHLNKCSVMVGVTLSGDSITYLMPLTTPGDREASVSTVVTIAQQLRQNGIRIEVLRPAHHGGRDEVNPNASRYLPMIPFFPMPKSFLSKN